MAVKYLQLTDHKYIAYSSIVLAGILLLAAWFYPKNNIEEIKSIQTNKPVLNRMANGYLFTVSIDNRDHYIAKKTDKNEYELLYITRHTPIQTCQKVLTTGLDEQFPEDVLVGYIYEVQAHPDDIYKSVIIKPIMPSNCPNQEPL